MEKIQKCKGKFEIFIFPLSDLDMTIIIGIEMDDNCGAFERFFEALFDIITHVMCLKESDLPIENKVKFYKYIFAGIPGLEEMV